MIVLVTISVRAEEYEGVEFPQGEESFADIVVGYTPGSYVQDPYKTPSAILGIPDYPSQDASEGHLSLGNGGNVVIRFTDNSLTTSGNTDLDLWIFEVGPAVESTDVEISQDGIRWISVGTIQGSKSGVDIDAYAGAGVVAGESYSFVRLTDVEDDDHSTGETAGADIDAVGAISSAPPVTDCSKWDVNANDKVDLADIIHGLQIIAGQSNAF